MLADTINSKKSGESPNLANREAASGEAISSHAHAGLGVRDTRTEEKELAIMIPTPAPVLRVVIILPTYNERENIGDLIDALQVQFKTLPHDMQILVVDDSSPDGTADVVRMKQASSCNVHLLMGQKSGLGAAYIRGMMHAMDQLGADAVFEMDADFSHKPEDVPRLMAALDAGADFVIGSRYVKGGSIPEKWGLLRRMNSWGGNIVARYVAGIYKVRDCTAGFRAIRTTLLKQISFDDLRVQGYAFQVALLHEAVSLGAVVKEVPVDFIDRTEGESKLGISDIIEFVLNAWWIRLHSSRTFIKFAVVGLSGVIVNLSVFKLLLEANVNKYLASPISIEASIITNFLLNNYWTFRWRKSQDHTHIKGLKFNMVSLVALAVSYSTFVVLSVLFPETAPEIHQISGIAPAMFINYFLNSYWTFKHAPDGKELNRE